MNKEDTLTRLGRAKTFFVAVWVIGSLATVLLLINALAWDGNWIWALPAFVIGTAAKWIGRALHRKRSRMLYEPAMIERGYSPEEAKQAWELAFYGGPDKLGELRAAERAENVRDQ